MDRQEIFSKVYVALTKQGCRAYDSTSRACKYIDGVGNKCAIGHILPEGHKAFSSTASIFFLMGAYPNLHEHFEIQFNSDIHFLSKLQTAHDSCTDDAEFEDDFESNMQDIARLHELKMPTQEGQDES